MHAKFAIAVAVAAIASSASIARAQAGSNATPKHTPICGAAVRIYHDKADLKAPYDTLTMPPGPPVQVHSPEEAEAAEMAMRDRAGSVGANALVVSDETVDTGDGNVRMRRSVQALFIPSDSARAIAACKK